MLESKHAVASTMWSRKTVLIIIIVLTIISSSHTFNTLTPWNKEVIYNWKAVIRAGTFQPARFVSHLALNGKVHLQTNNNVTHVKIADLTYNLYNGNVDNVQKQKTHDLPITLEVQDIHNVFKIVYDDHGRAVGIATEHQEQEFSRNLKRAMASILQIYDSVVEKQEQNHYPHAFVAHESSIYGYTEVDYNVIPYENDTVEVHKMHNKQDLHNLYQYTYMATNTEAGVCEAPVDQVITHESIKKYIIVKENDQHVVKRIEADGAIGYNPYRAQSVTQFIVTKQIFELERVVPIQEKLELKQEHYDKGLTYRVSEEVTGSNSRHIIDYEKLMPQVKEIIQDIHQYLYEDHIHTREPGTQRGQAVNRVRKMLSRFSLEKLKELHETLSGEALRIYHQILPLVGSQPAVLLVKDLVVQKAVSEDVAIHMLQHFYGHVITPSVNLLSELEELIRLKENIQWSVRRVAILSFASLVHRSHKFYTGIYSREKNEPQNGTENVNPSKTEQYDLEKPYEKYVTEYINKIKSSKDYKVQMTYIMALYNMKLHSIIKHIIPAFGGEPWRNRNLGWITVIASAPAVLGDWDPDTAFEAYWPIITNRKEYVEVRMIAYYFFMESQPTANRLGNIFWYMMTEPDEEFYKYHYTYVQSMISSNDPCRQESRARLSRMSKFMYPPPHGQASAKIYDFKDPNFGFHATVQNYLVKTNESVLFGGIFTSQDFNFVHKDFMFYLKIHGVKQVHSNILVDILENKMAKLVNNKDVHIELVIFKLDHVIDTYHFDTSNLHELSHLIDFFTKDSHSLTNDLLHISYHRFYTALIPTDLGTPALWEYLMPVVYHYNINISKQIYKNAISIQVRNRGLNWIHHRHGLSFYNPIVDVWQGVNSYHAFDMVLPLNLDININSQLQSLQISWNKHDNSLMNIGGLRIHEKQMTFVEDDYHRNILNGSSPSSGEWETVSKGKEYRNNYPLVDHDDPNTGYKWYIGSYDCVHYFANSSINRHIQYFAQPLTKHVDSPISHLLMSFLNFFHYAIRTPRPGGTCGLIIRAQPSQEYVVSNIDLSVTINEKTTEKEKYYYTFGQKITTQLTYSVKNKGQILKSWNVNTILDMNPGRTVNNLKMHLSRTVLGQKDQVICANAVKRWSKDEVSGHLEVADGQCSEDDTVVEITMTGRKSYAQEHEQHVYATCQYVLPLTVPPYKMPECLFSHTTARHYVYNVQIKNLTTEFKEAFASWWDTIKGHYMSYYSYQDQNSKDIGDNNLRVDVVYPMQQHEVDIQATTAHHIYSFTGVPIGYCTQWIFTPDSLPYTRKVFDAHETDQVDHCVVYTNRHRLNHYPYVQKVVPNEWTLYVGDDKENPQKAVYVKHVADDQIAMKVVDQGHHFEIFPHGEHHQITVDGKVVPSEEHEHYEDWVSFVVFHDDVNHHTSVMLYMSGLHLDYKSTKYIIILVPKVQEEERWHGSCYEDF